VDIHIGKLAAHRVELRGLAVCAHVEQLLRHLDAVLEGALRANNPPPPTMSDG
jgi:hypothetical protein